ncbi:hypothetical protein F3Y22_tig00111715pilonHSYRG00013 [Hibiscus syriacus]|uniref:Uncharacterized protein n=1 Tax=Hibiscus syriacus TaxID=106335 RepID=A0A6A2YI38_HIBSY|nr:hypothetical protein F3Y22_tig00111715pilonHSYRG00013 [Hibiscus syriacus]
MVNATMWRIPAPSYHDRPLSKSGRVDDVAVSRELQRMGWIPQLILSRLASLSSLSYFENLVLILEGKEELNLLIHVAPAMPCEPEKHLKLCRNRCMGHNRGWEEAASMFTGTSVELKTCNAALLEAPGQSWEEGMISGLMEEVGSTLCRTGLGNYLLN